MFESLMRISTIVTYYLVDECRRVGVGGAGTCTAHVRLMYDTGTA